jgi:hypothetical protein
MSRSVALALFAALACAPATPPPAPPPVSVPAPVPPPPPPAPDPLTIRADDLRRDLEVFASDAFRGRESGTPDADRAARFLVERLSTLGLEAAGDSGFYQRVPMMRTIFGPNTRFTITHRGQTRTLALGSDVLPLIELDPSLPPPRTTADAEIAFAGYGLPMPTLGRNDLANIELTSKVVVVVNGAPANASPEQRKELESINQLGARLGQILPHRPAAIVVMLPDGAKEDLYAQFLPSVLRSVSLARPIIDVPEAQRPLPMLVLARARAGSPFLPDGWPADDRPQQLTGRRFVARTDVRTENFVGYNVIAVARGSDPAFNRSYVALGAHYDHVGILPPVGGDSIANGADDDGSGSVTLLAVARVLKEQPARRSALFVWHTAEEKGLLGSEYFTAHPTVPIDSIVAQVNADMIGRNAPDELYVVGPGAAPAGQSRVLGQIVDSVNATLRSAFRFNREWDSPTHPERIYERSDHFSYAQKGIPIVFFTSGLHDQYHGVDDEIERIDFEKMARVGELLVGTGRAIGNRALRPR